MLKSPIPMMAQSPFLWPLPPYSWCPWCPMPGSRHVICMPRHDVRIGWDVDVGSREGITWAGKRGCCAMVRWVNVGVIPASLGTTRWLPNEWLQEIWPLKMGRKLQSLWENQTGFDHSTYWGSWGRIPRRFCKLRFDHESWCGFQITRISDLRLVQY